MDIEEKGSEGLSKDLQKQTVQGILKDPKKYRKIMLILQQTLYNLGYPQSAKMLEQESQVPYYSRELLEIKANLQKNDFEGAISIIDSIGTKSNILEQKQQQIGQKSLSMGQNFNNNNDQTQKVNRPQAKFSNSALSQPRNMIYQTYCMEKILNQEYEDAMKIISQKIQSETKKEHLCQALVLGNHHVTVNQLQKYLFIKQRKKEEIFKYCLAEYQEIGEREISKVIQAYTSYEDNNEFKSLLPGPKMFPPMRILSYEQSSTIKHPITHIKVAASLEELVVIQENGKDFQQISIFKINKNNWKYQKEMSESGQLSLKVKYPIFSISMSKTFNLMYKSKRQSVQCLTLSQNKQRALIGLCSFGIIQLYNSSLQMLISIQSPNKIQKFLHIEFHPLSQLLYNCGYFEYMNLYDSTGQIVMAMHPYPKMRKFLFLRNDTIVGISLVTNKIYKHSIEEQVLLKEGQFDQGIMPMDLCKDEKRKLLGVSSIQFIYLISEDTLEVMGKTISPTNPNKLLIEIRFYSEFLITLAKSFTSFQLSLDPLNSSNFLIKKTKQWFGQGTFTINGQMMISGNKELVCWQEGNVDLMQDEDDYHDDDQMDPDYDGHRIQQMEDEDEESGEMDSGQLEDQSDDESIDDEEQDPEEQIEI